MDWKKYRFDVNLSDQRLIVYQYRDGEMKEARDDSRVNTFLLRVNGENRIMNVVISVVDKFGRDPSLM